MDESVLKLTATLLRLNPDNYTVWNYRRKTLLHLFETLPEVNQGKSSISD
jgi:adenylosuccinate lyase